jgi:hypothetical protein
MFLGMRFGPSEVEDAPYAVDGEISDRRILQVDEPLVVKLCFLRHLSPPVARVARVKKNKHEGDLRHQG